MQRLILSPAKRSQLNNELRRGKDVSVYRRAAALLALSEGDSITKVASLFNVSRQTLYNWIAAYGDSGRDGDLRDARRSGRPSLWTGELKQLLDETVGKAPVELGYSAESWSLKLLRSHLVQRAKVELTEECLRRYLHRAGYIWRKRGGALRATEAAVEESAADVGAPATAWNDVQSISCPPCALAGQGDWGRNQNQPVSAGGVKNL